MTAFPLLHVPPDARDRLLDWFTTMELFDLTQCSSKALKMVRNHQATSSKRQFEIRVTIESSPSLTMTTNDSELHWQFFGERDIKRVDLEAREAFEINGKRLEVSRDVPRQRFYCRTLVTLHEMLTLAEYLSEVFNAKIAKADVGIDFGLLETIRSFPFYRSLREVTVFKTDCDLERCPPRKPELSHAEVRQILNDSGEIDFLRLFCYAGEDFVYEKPITVKDLWASVVPWFSRSNLLNLDCAQADVQMCQLKEEDLNAFLRQWMDGENTKFRSIYVELTRTKKSKSLNMAKILDGVPVFPGWPKREEDTNLPRRYAPFHEGYDFRRESDGMLGSVVTFGLFDIKDTFMFVAWHDPNPNVPFDMIVQ